MLKAVCGRQQHQRITHSSCWPLSAPLLQYVLKTLIANRKHLQEYEIRSQAFFVGCASEALEPKFCRPYRSCPSFQSSISHGISEVLYAGLSG